MLCKLGATGPNVLNAIDDGIVYYSTKFYGIQIRAFEIKASEVWRFSYILYGKMAWST